MKLSERIAEGLGIDASYVEIIASRNDLYKRYFIKKKNGGKREILQPSRELKVVQRWLLRNILFKFPLSDYSYAYTKGNSVKKNALVHRDSNYIFHTDIRNFFPSISRDMVEEYFLKNKKIVHELDLNDEDLELLMNICLYKGEYLVVGSVASPRMANIIMYDFDMELKKALDGIGKFSYTRYADDIIISSKKYIDESVIDIVNKVMTGRGFEMNNKKNYFMSRKSQRCITGVVIDNNRNKLSVGNKKYKMMERSLYQFLVKGKGDYDYLKGYLSYMREINQEQYDQITRIYKKYDKKRILFD